MLGDLYAYYSSVGVATAGYPTTDSAAAQETRTVAPWGNPTTARCTRMAASLQARRRARRPG